MDYLHGDVVEKELEAACYYEYARESEVLRETAAIHKTAFKKFKRWRPLEAKRREKIGWPAPPVLPSGVEVYLAVEEKFHCGAGFMQGPCCFIWTCLSFPTKSWKQLADTERKSICCAFGAPVASAQPLPMLQVPLLDAMGVWDDFKAMAEQVRLERPFKRSYPILDGTGHCRKAKEENQLRRLRMLRSDTQNRADIQKIINGLETRIKKQSERGRQVHALFTIDFGKTEKRLLEEFRAWLRLADIKKRFGVHRSSSPIGKSGTFKDRLKDLAAWRLYRELGCDLALDFADDNRKRDATKKPRAFHDPRKPRSRKGPINLAHLYGEESGFLRAKARALKHLRDLIPWEDAIGETKPTDKRISKRIS
jgi:hypothetical protein